MREPAAKRILFAAILALAAGWLVASFDPMDRIKADLRADAQGFAFSLEVAVHAVEDCLKG